MVPIGLFKTKDRRGFGEENWFCDRDRLELLLIVISSLLLSARQLTSEFLSWQKKVETVQHYSRNEFSMPSGECTSTYKQHILDGQAFKV